MDVPNINISEKEAEKMYDEYSAVLKERADELTTQARQEAEQIKKMAWHAKNGKRVIDIRTVMKLADVNEARLPKLAIVPITARKCYYFERERGGGRFSKNQYNYESANTDVIVPQNTFPIPTEVVNTHDENNKVVGTRNAVLQDFNLLRANCDVPIIPLAIRPKGEDGKYILFEVERWQVRNMQGRQSKDPLLLQRINDNMFVVLAAWDLTELEASVMK